MQINIKQRIIVKMTIDEDYLWLELKVESLGESVQLDLTLGEGPDWGRGGGSARKGGGGGGEDSLGQQTSQVTGLQHGLQNSENMSTSYHRGLLS